MGGHSVVGPVVGFTYCALQVGCQSAQQATLQNNTLWSNVEYFYLKVCIFLLCGAQFTYTLQLAA